MVTFAFSAGPGFDTVSFREQAVRKIMSEIENKATGRIALPILMALPPKWDFVLSDRFGIRREAEILTHLAIKSSMHSVPR
jgi:hypothetical protein